MHLLVCVEVGGGLHLPVVFLGSGIVRWGVLGDQGGLGIRVLQGRHGCRSTQEHLHVERFHAGAGGWMDHGLGGDDKNGNIGWRHDDVGRHRRLTLGVTVEILK